jgi:hypothetical protein
MPGTIEEHNVNPHGVLNFGLSDSETGRLGFVRLNVQVQDENEHGRDQTR